MWGPDFGSPYLDQYNPYACSCQAIIHVIRLGRGVGLKKGIK